MSEKKNVLTAQQVKNLQTWIEALESGNYRQGWGELCSQKENIENRYCCLGVACEVLNFPKETCEFDNTKIYFQFKIENDLDVSLLASWPNHTFKTFFGLPGHFSDDLVDMNDYGGYSFSAIAQEIRSFVSENYGVEL